jgi:hypothetical protein
MALMLAAPAAFAQDDVTARRKAAQDYADSAFDLMQKGRHGAAADLFKKADEAFHSPVFVLFAAEAEEKQGNLLEARALLQKVVDEELADYAPDAFRKAQDDARERAAALDERIPSVTVTVRPASGTSVSIDGRDIAASELGTPIQLLPGRHEAVAIGADGTREERAFELAEGDRSSVELILATVPISGDDDDDDVPVVADDGAGVPTWVWPTVAYGVGGVGLIIGVAAGGAFLSQKSDLDEACNNDGDGNDTTCPTASKKDGDAVATLGDISTVGWVIAGVGAVAGTVLLFVPLGDEGSIALGMAPTSLSLSGKF